MNNEVVYNGLTVTARKRSKHLFKVTGVQVSFTFLGRIDLKVEVKDRQASVSLELTDGQLSRHAAQLRMLSVLVKLQVTQQRPLFVHTHRH